MAKEEEGAEGSAIRLSKDYLQGLQADKSSGRALSNLLKRYAQIVHSATEIALITMDPQGVVTGWGEGVGRKRR